MKKINNWAMIVCGIIIFSIFIYGSYWVAKTISYKIFYEDMVKQTILELVKNEALKP